MSLSKWFYPGMFTEERMQEVKRSSVWPVALTLMCAVNENPETTLSIFRFGKVPNTSWMIMATPEGLLPIEIVHHEGKYQINKLATGFNLGGRAGEPVIESTNLRYVMRRLSTKNSGTAEIIGHIKSIHRLIQNSLTHAFVVLRDKHEPKQTAGTFNLDSEAQEWAARILVGGAQKMIAPPRALQQIERLWNYYSTHNQVFEDYINKIDSWVGGEKYMIIHVTDKNESRWYIGAVDCAKYLEEGLKTKQSPYVVKNPMIVTMPFQCYNTIDDLDSAIYEKTGQRIKAKLTMLKLNRGVTSVRDDNGYIPDVLGIIPYDNTGAMAWTFQSSGVGYFMFDKA